jgi:hypothetical protein
LAAEEFAGDFKGRLRGFLIEEFAGDAVGLDAVVLHDFPKVQSRRWVLALLTGAD